MEVDDELKSLPALQDAIKRQANAYKTDFHIQYSALSSALERFEAQPQVADSLMQELVMFCAQTGAYYPAPDGDANMCQELADVLIRLIRMHSDVARESHVKTFMSALVLMDNRRFIDRHKLYTFFLDMLSLQNDLVPFIALKQIVKHLGGGKVRVSDSDKKLWQRVIFARYGEKKSEGASVLARRRLQFIMISLYMKAAWQDPVTCNTIAQGVFDKCPKIVLNAARFLLGEVRKLVLSEASTAKEVELDDEARRRKAAEMVAAISRDLNGSNKVTGKALKNLEKLKEVAAHELEDLEGRVNANSQIQQGILRAIYDPHTFASNLFNTAARKTSNSKLPYKTRLMLLKIVSRFIGKMDVHVPGFLNFMTKYMNPTQEKATVVMAIVAEAVSEVVPVDELQAVTRHIADHFAVAASSSEAMTVGINTIREMCVRNKHAITPELLEDLLRLGRESHAESVNIAAKSLRTHYRLVDPMMLPRKERSRGNDLAAYATKSDQLTGLIPGMDILVGMRAARAGKKSLAATDPNHVDVTEEEALAFQTSRIMTDEELSALRKIQVKMSTAQSMGLSLKQWMKGNEKSWEELNILKRSKRQRVSENPVDEQSQVDQHLDQHSGLDSAISGEESSESELAGLSSGSDSEGEEDKVDSCSQVDGELPVGSSSCESGSGSGSESDDETSESSTDSTEESGNSEAEGFVDMSKIRGRVRMSKEKKRALTKRQKLEERETMRDRRHGGKVTNRAGISNRVQARSKPMAMLRQKRKNREKRVLSAKDKVTGLKAHIKTLKTTIKQKFRRR